LAFEAEHAVDATGFNGFPAKRQQLKLTSTVGTPGSFVNIRKMWIDNYSSNLQDPQSPYISSSPSLIPKMKFFPFFFDPNYTLIGGASSNFYPYLGTSTTHCDIFAYSVESNVASGYITHPLSDFSFGSTPSVPSNTQGYMGLMRDNYRFSKLLTLHDFDTTGDSLYIDILFCTNVIDEYSGVLNISYMSVPANGLWDNAESKMLRINLSAAISDSNVSEIDYTNFNVISELEGVNMESPYMSIQLG